MRVIAGTHRGAKLSTLDTEEIRPTSDRVKEAFFSAIQFDLPSARVLDLFAGSGQLGIEALSRGALSCVFVDSNPEATAVIKSNLANLKLMPAAKVATTDAFTYLKHSKDSFDVVLLDPPYHQLLIPKALKLLDGRLSAQSVVVCEHECEEELPENVSGISLYKSYKYGKIRISLYKSLD